MNILGKWVARFEHAFWAATSPGAICAIVSRPRCMECWVATSPGAICAIVSRPRYGMVVAGAYRYAVPAAWENVFIRTYFGLDYKEAMATEVDRNFAVRRTS